jgi:DNA-binding CsgD family transcriptional regulator
MKISVETVNKHRFAIRRKLQLRNTHRNLASYLKQL